jgi:hypothetical protein
MYNEEKKMITDIKAGRNVNENLERFAHVAMKGDFEYSCHKFMLNKITLLDKLSEDDFRDNGFSDNYQDDTYKNKCLEVIETLTDRYIVGDTDSCSADDIELLGAARAEVTSRMKVLTAYTDAFEIYEYILNRKEFQFEENFTAEYKDLQDSIDVKAFSDEIKRFIFADQDKMAVNAKIKSLLEQLPIRITKNKFYDILGDTLDIYNGVENSALDDFVDMIESTVLIKKPEGFETIYPGLYAALSKLKTADYSSLDYAAYSEYSGILKEAVDFLSWIVSVYILIIELINDLYVMLLAIGEKSSVSDGCKKAIDILKTLSESKDVTSVYDMLEEVVGLQEEAGEYKVMLESSVYDIQTGYPSEIAQANLVEEYKALDKMDKLLSGSMFVDIDNEDEPDVLPVSTEQLAACKEQLVEEFVKLFEAGSRDVNKAVMAKTLGIIPVFFNTTQEIESYIDNSLLRCKDKGELLAVYMVIKQMMED